MRIQINDPRSDDDVIYAPFNGQPAPQEPPAPDWLEDIDVNAPVSPMSEQEAFFTENISQAEYPYAEEGLQSAIPTGQEEVAQEVEVHVPFGSEATFQGEPPRSRMASKVTFDETDADLANDECVSETCDEDEKATESGEPTEKSFADEADSQNDELEDETEEETAAESEPETVPKEDYDSLQQRYDRLLADWENYKRRTAREFEEAKENANQNLLKAMMPAFDDFGRVVFHAQNNDDPAVNEVVSGVKAIHRKLFKALAREGVIEIDPAPGESFDMNRHQAIERCMADDEHPVDTVVKVYQVGYEMNGKILRPAMVAVTV